MQIINVKLKDSFHRPFLVTLRGNQFIKNEITQVDLDDAEVQAYLLKYEKYIEVLDNTEKKVEKKKVEKKKVEENKTEKPKSKKSKK